MASGEKPSVCGERQNSRPHADNVLGTAILSATNHGETEGLSRLVNTVLAPDDHIAHRTPRACSKSSKPISSCFRRPKSSAKTFEMTWSSSRAGIATLVYRSTRRVCPFCFSRNSDADLLLGYSGVVIYTRNSTCAPIRAEEGITGILTPPNTSASFRDLAEYEQIGGYPNSEQMSLSEVDAITLDSEGRCVILEFPAFVLLGTYCPANRDETRDEFRLGFLNVLDARIRNLVAIGKRVIWTGDLNISREELDTAAAEESMRKNGMDGQQYVSTPSRRIFNQLLVGGKVFGGRDEGRENSILWDICRGFHEDRKGMFTCWETKINARPGNYGARIDYVLCSAEMKDWFSESNIQEGLMVSRGPQFEKNMADNALGLRSLSCLCNLEGQNHHSRYRDIHQRCCQPTRDVQGQ